MTTEFMQLLLSMVFRKNLTFLVPQLFLSACCSLFISAASLAQSISVQLTDQESNPIRDVVIELLVSSERQGQYQNKQDVEVDQVGKEFVPLVSTIVAGNFISFPNSDDILHHVYSFSEINTFNIPLYGKEDSDRFKQEFGTPGIVEIGCNIHDWMLAYIYVAETTLNSISGEEGIAVIEDLPVGEFQLRIWHPRLSGSVITQNVAISAGEESHQEIVLELERERRIRRAPSSSRNRYK